MVAGRHDLVTGGIEYERESFTQSFSSPSFSTPRTTDRQSSLAVFGQDRLSLLQDRLQLLAAVRTEGFAIRNPQSVPGISDVPVKRALTGDASISYLFRGPDTKLRAHVGNSFRAPSLSERFTDFEGRRIGNPFLRPERGISVDGGVDQTLFRNKLRLSATYFYDRLQQVIVSTELFKQTNSLGALSRGLETSLSAAPGWGLSMTAAYTFTNSAQALPDATLRSDDVLLPAGTLVQSFSIPRHLFSFDVNKAIKRGFNLNFGVYSTSGHNFTLFDPLFFSQVLFGFRGYTTLALGG
ncbi:MAG: TonB-dependent receptor plug domain-containing protein, partial [Blastocatellia bacterium]